MTDSSQSRVIDFLIRSSLSHSRAILTQSAQHCMQPPHGLQPARILPLVNKPGEGAKATKQHKMGLECVSCRRHGFL